MDGRLAWTDCDEAGDYVVPNVLSPRDLVSRPDNMDETVPHKCHTHYRDGQDMIMNDDRCGYPVSKTHNPTQVTLRHVIFHFALN